MKRSMRMGLARLRLGPTRHARRPLLARTFRTPRAHRSLVPVVRKSVSKAWLECKDRRGSIRLARLRLRPTTHARRLFLARAFRVRHTCRSLGPVGGKSASKTWIECTDRRRSRRLGGPRRARGATAVETVLSIAVLIGVLSALMAVIQDLYAKDRAERAARAGARAIALLESAPADQANLEETVCRGMRDELGLDRDHDCSEGWSIEVEAFEGPSKLLADDARTAGSPLGGEDRDLVLLRLTARETPAKTEDEKKKPATGVAAVAIAQNDRQTGTP